MLVTELYWTFHSANTSNSYLVWLIQERLQIVPHSYMQKELVKFMRAALTQCSGEIFKEDWCPSW